MIDEYLAELGRELGAVGIRGRLRRRILAESEDHLRADDGALDRFGTPEEVANTFAAELGARARHGGPRPARSWHSASRERSTPSRS